MNPTIPTAAMTAPPTNHRDSRAVANRDVMEMIIGLTQPLQKFVGMLELVATPVLVAAKSGATT